MSLAAYKAAWVSAATGTEKLVLLALADFADDTGTAWPSQTRLGEMTGLSVRAVRRAVAALVDAGDLIELAEGRGAGCTKRVRFAALTAAEPIAKPVAADRFTDEEKRPAATGIDDQNRNGATGMNGQKRNEAAGMDGENRPPQTALCSGNRPAVAEKADAGGQKTGQPWPMNRKEPSENQEQQHARETEPPGNPRTAAAVSELTSAGFTPAAAADLAARYSAERISEVLRWAAAMQRAGRLRGAPPAWIRRALDESWAEPAEARAERVAGDGRQADEAARRRELRDVERRRREAAEATARRDGVVAAVAALLPEARAAVLDAARQRFIDPPPEVRDDWARFPTWVAWVQLELDRHRRAADPIGLDHFRDVTKKVPQPA